MIIRVLIWKLTTAHVGVWKLVYPRNTPPNTLKFYVFHCVPFFLGGDDYHLLDFEVPWVQTKPDLVGDQEDDRGDSQGLPYLSHINLLARVGRLVGGFNF